MKYLLLLAVLFSVAAGASAQAQWEPTGGAGSGVMVRSLFAYGDTLLAGTQRNGIFRSADGGATWTQVLDLDGFTNAVLRIASPAPGTLLAAAGTDGVYRSGDDGRTWDLSNAGLSDPPELFAADLAVSDNYVLVGTSDGVYFSDDQGRSWDPSSIGVVGWDALSLAAEGNWAYTYLYAGFPNTGFWHSDDGGRVWTYPFSLNVADVVALAAREATVLAGGLFAVFRSADRGFTFSSVVGLPPESGGYCFSFEDGLDAYVGHGQGVHRSADDGRTWAFFSEGLPPSPYDPGEPTPVNALAFLDGYLYAGTERDGVWRRLVGPVTVAAAPVDPPVVIGPGGGSFDFTVTLTNVTDQPQTVQAWTEVTGPLDRNPVIGPRPVALSPGQTVTQTIKQRVPGAAPAGTYTYAVRAGVFPGIPFGSDAFAVTKQEAPLAHAGNGGGESWATSGWGAAPASASGLPAGLPGGALSEAHPNPFSSQARLTLEVVEAQPVRIAVYDALGRIVAILHDGLLGAGAHALTLDGSSLPAGVYFVRVAGETFGGARRVLLVR
jgi:photosystem II stability/assembly factor-like uncharacterized protein